MMYEAKLIAVVTSKKNKKASSTWEVMRLSYKVEDNTLWITDYRGCIVDFDLELFDVEIKMAESQRAGEGRA